MGARVRFSTAAVSSTYRRRTYPAIPTTRPSRNGMRQPQASSAAVDMLARRDERRRAREPVTNPEVADVRSSPGSIQAVAARPPCLEARRYFAMGAERGHPLLEASLALAASRVSFWRDMLQLKLLSIALFRSSVYCVGECNRRSPLYNCSDAARATSYEVFRIRQR